VPPGRPGTTNRLTGRAWAAAAARRPIWARHASLAGPGGPCRRRAVPARLRPAGRVGTVQANKLLLGAYLTRSVTVLLPS
jgi:hypothetical protein